LAIHINLVFGLGRKIGEMTAEADHMIMVPGSGAEITHRQQHPKATFGQWQLCNIVGALGYLFDKSD